MGGSPVVIPTLAFSTGTFPIVSSRTPTEAPNGNLSSLIEEIRAVNPDSIPTSAKLR